MRAPTLSTVRFAVIVAIVLALFTSGIVVGAAGAPLILGEGNFSGNQQTRLTSNGSSATLKLNNSANGRALEVTDSEAAPLKITAPSGRPPMLVNSGTKVLNLNADKVDGKSASAFVPKNLALGASQSGIWGEQAAADENGLVVISFPSRLPAAIPLANTHYVTSPTADCPGAGQAAPGHLCVYQTFSGSMTFDTFWNPEDFTQGAGRGGVVAYMDQSSQTANAWGTWTVTAPTSLAMVGPTPQRPTAPTGPDRP